MSVKERTQNKRRIGEFEVRKLCPSSRIKWFKTALYFSIFVKNHNYLCRLSFQILTNICWSCDFPQDWTDSNNFPSKPSRPFVCFCAFPQSPADFDALCPTVHGGCFQLMFENSVLPESVCGKCFVRSVVGCCQFPTVAAAFPHKVGSGGCGGSSRHFRKRMMGGSWRRRELKSARRLVFNRRRRASIDREANAAARFPCGKTRNARRYGRSHQQRPPLL